MPGVESIVKRIQNHGFKQVTKVVDASNSIPIELLPDDVLKGKRYKPTECAFAKACSRQIRIDGVMINRGSSYLIQGKTAFRFITPENMTRAILDFDKNGHMQPGRYLLRAPALSSRLGQKRGGDGRYVRPKKKTTLVHYADRVRRITD